MNKRFYALLATTALIATACGNGAENEEDTGAENDPNVDAEVVEGDGDQSIRVAWWGGQERHDMTLEAIELFTEETGITVETEYTGWDGYWERLNTQAAGSNLPDVIQMDNSYLNEYDSNSLLVDLAPYTEDGTIDLSDVDDVYQEILEVDGRTLGISGGANALAVIYNVDLTEEHGVDMEPGFTYQDLYDINLEIKETIEADGGEYWGYDFANSEYELFNNYVRQNGQSFYNEDGNGLGFEEPVLVDFFEWLQTMVADGAAPTHDIMLSYHEGGDSMVQDGTSLMRTAASNQLIGDQQSTDYELGLTVLPSLDGTHANFIRPSMSWSVTDHAEDVDAAAEFINFMTNSIEANEILQGERGVPISSVVRDHLSEQVEESTRKTFEFLDVVADYTEPADPISPPGETEVRGSFLRVIESLKYEQVTPEEAAEQFINEANGILN
ncbi:ABC transporter substrate-binding protein [Alkalibacterium iburiense]|uniref:ABC transporter substrate-binding protein n=1 Tax=Alkalibacterium iburiense TaxID=290589 RepID=A0ABN0XEP0_9LACT